MTTLLIATRNAHKVGEIRAILGSGFNCLTLEDFPQAPEVIEDADTFAGNATKKATELARWVAHAGRSMLDVRCSMFVLADDSGLEVDALAGQPGVHSARFASLDSGPSGNSPDADNNAKLVRLLKDVPMERRTARFRCVLALVAVTPHSALGIPHLFDGACEGRLLLGAIGRGGFGYDPLFVPDGFNLSFAELGEDVKNRLSHRSKALAKLRGRLESSGMRNLQ